MSSFARRRLERLEEDLKPETERSSRPELRARMKAALGEIARARKEGRPPSPEAAAVAEAIERRRSEASGH